MTYVTLDSLIILKIILKIEEEPEVTDAIKEIYRHLDDIPYLGGPSTLSKVMHLFNPKVFVMWDDDIRNLYLKRKCNLRASGEGYLEFLKCVKRELEEAFNDRKAQTSQSWGEI